MTPDLQKLFAKNRKAQKYSEAICAKAYLGMHVKVCFCILSLHILVWKVGLHAQETKALI